MEIPGVDYVQTCCGEMPLKEVGVCVEERKTTINYAYMEHAEVTFLALALEIQLL